MSIIHVLTNLDLGGAQITTASVCLELRQRGIDIGLAVGLRGGRSRLLNESLLKQLGSGKVPIYDIPHMVRPLHPFHDFIALHELRSLIRKLRPQVVHTHMSKAGVIGRLAALLENVPCIVHTVHGWPFEVGGLSLLRSPLIGIERYLASRTDRLLAVTEWLARRAATARIADPHRYDVIRSGIDLSDFRSPLISSKQVREEFLIPSSAPIVGSIMSLVPAKRPLDFLDVASRVSEVRPDVHFIVIGEGPLLRPLRQAIARRGLSNRFRLLGARSDVPRLLQAFDVFLLTSGNEGLPRVVQEAMASRLPVIATDTGGVSDLVRHGETGLLAKVADTRTLANHVIWVLGNQLLADKLAQAAANLLSDEFDVRTVVERHIEIYSNYLSVA